MSRRHGIVSRIGFQEFTIGMLAPTTTKKNEKKKQTIRGGVIIRQPTLRKLHFQIAYGWWRLAASWLTVNALTTVNLLKNRLSMWWQLYSAARLPICTFRFLIRVWFAARIVAEWRATKLYMFVFVVLSSLCSYHLQDRGANSLW